MNDKSRNEYRIFFLRKPKCFDRIFDIDDNRNFFNFISMNVKKIDIIKGPIDIIKMILPDTDEKFIGNTYFDWIKEISLFTNNRDLMMKLDLTAEAIYIEINPERTQVEYAALLEDVAPYFSPANYHSIYGDLALLPHETLNASLTFTTKILQSAIITSVGNDLLHISNTMVGTRERDIQEAYVNIHAPNASPQFNFKLGDE